MKILGINKFTVGKADVTVTVQGCLDCGVLEAESAIEAQNLMFRMGDRNYRIEFKRCPSCHSARYHGLNRPEPVGFPVAILRR